MEAYSYEQYRQAAQALAARLGSFRPRILLILGSGLGTMADTVDNPLHVPYDEVPHMKRSTAPDHKGRFVFGRLGRQDVAVMQGRLHTYEGWSFADVSFPVRDLRLLGAEALVVTNAAGAVNTPPFPPGTSCSSPTTSSFSAPARCAGPNLDAFGPRFPDMSAVYTPALRDIARQAARALDIPLREGVYMFFPGPQYETPAEVRSAPGPRRPTPWACPQCRRPSRRPTAA